MVFLKDRSGRTYAQFPELDYSAVTESYDNDRSRFILPAGALTPDDAGAWLVWEGRLFLAAEVTPGSDRCQVMCEPPEAVFDREIIYTAPGEGVSTEAFIAEAIADEFRYQTDAAYAQPALRPTAAGATDFVPPIEQEEGEDPGEGPQTFNLCEYIRMVRDSFDVFTVFALTSEGIAVTIGPRARAARNVPFGDGHSVLTRRTYGDADSVAKVTTVQGDASTDWYLAADGEISSSVPEQRARGRWELKILGEDDDPEQIAREAFGSTAGGHRIEFDSDLALRLGDELTFRLDGTTVRGRLSYAARTNGDGLWHYKSGELVTGLFAKIKKQGGAA